MKGKNILIVSRASYGLLTVDNKLIETLQDNNLFYIYSIRTHDLPKQGTFKELHQIELRDSETYLPKLVEQINNRYKLDYIISISEQDLMPVTKIREHLGFKGLTSQQVSLFRDKGVMKLKAQQSSINCGGWLVTNDKEEILQFFHKNKKIIIKPRDSYGSMGCIIFSEIEQLSTWLDHTHENLDNFIVEEFINLPVHHFDALVRNGEIMFASVGTYATPLIYYSQNKFVITTITNSVSKYYQAGQEMLKTIINTWDIKDGVFHLEFFSDGINHYFCEVAIRPAGGGIAEAIFYTWNVNLNEEHVRIQMNLPPLFSTHIPQEEKFTAIMGLLAKNSGTLTHINLDTIQQIPCITKLKQTYQIGEQVLSARYSADFILTIFLESDNEEYLNTSIKSILSSITYEISD